MEIGCVQQRLLVNMLSALPFFLEIKLSAGQEDINRSGVHLLENVLKGKWLIPHAHPLVSFLPTGTQKLLPRVVELRSLTTWAPGSPELSPDVFYVRKKKATVKFFVPWIFLFLSFETKSNVNFTLYNWRRRHTRKMTGWFNKRKNYYST